MEPSWIAAIPLAAVTAAYGLMVLWFDLHLLKRKKASPGADIIPFVSVVIAARNEENTIGFCLQDLLSQDYPPDRLEIILSDDHSSDRTVEKANEIRDQSSGAGIRILTAEPDAPSGKKPALAKAVRTARGELILTTDADTRRGPGWIRAMVREFSQSGKQMILGPVLLTGSSLFQQIQRLEFLGVMGITAGSASAGTPLMCNGANLLYARTTFTNTGGFEDNLKYPSGDDQFFLSSVRKSYRKSAAAFAFRQEAIVSTPAETSLAGFLHQRMRWVSKSKGYRDPLVILLGLLTYLASAFLLAFGIAGIFNSDLFLPLLVCWGIKILSDLSLTVKMAGFFKMRNELWLYIPAQLFQVIYVPVAGLAGLIFPYRWKGRRIRA